jgi:hypothetical protein
MKSGREKGEPVRREKGNERRKNNCENHLFFEMIMEPNRIWHRSITPIAVQYDKVGADAQIIGTTAFHRSITNHAPRKINPVIIPQTRRMMPTAPRQPTVELLL